MYLIKQITNHDIEDKPSSYHTIDIPTKEGTISEEVEYKTIFEDIEIIKLGYCCEEKGVIYPIFLKDTGDYNEFKLNERCMFEVDPQRFNNEPKKEKRNNVIITGVEVPVGINFTLDYIELV